MQQRVDVKETSAGWLKRLAVLVVALVREPLYFMLSDTRSGIARVFINGRFIGETRDLGSEGHKVAPADRRAGDAHRDRLTPFSVSAGLPQAC